MGTLQQRDGSANRHARIEGIVRSFANVTQG
jgi:hypothetical protein